MSIQSEFQDGLSKGTLLVQSCNSCGAKQMYPRQRCLQCYSKDLGWTQASGKGKLLSYTVVRAAAPTAFQEDTPYGLAIVKLEEGPQLLGRLVPGEDGEFGNYDCDCPVVFTPASATEVERRPVAWFDPA